MEREGGTGRRAVTIKPMDTSARGPRISFVLVGKSIGQIAPLHAQ